MKLGRLIVNFSKDPAPSLDQEVGTAISPQAGMLLNGDAIDTSKLKISDFVKMRKGDGTARALYSIMTLPILSLPWDIIADADDPNGEQASFVEDVFKLPPHKGGMTTPMSLVLADALRAVLEGYRLFEKVWTLDAQNRIVYRKIAPRDNQTLTLRYDPRGGFNGAKQMAYIGDKYSDVVIPVERCFLFTYGKEMNPLYGESAFTSAYYHYDEKRKLYYLGRLAAQALSIPPKVGKAPKNAKQDQMDSVAAALNNLVGVNSATVLPEGYDLILGQIGAGRFDVMGLINHHNAEMARSVLAHFLMLGTGSSTGSWALSQDQSDMFIMALKGLQNSLEEHINSYLIPELHSYNFETPHYSKFQFAEMTDGMIGVLKEAFLKVMDKSPQGVPDYVYEGIVQRMADQLDIERPDGEKAKTNEIGKTSSAKPAPAPAGGPQLHDHRKSTDLDDDQLRWGRPLSPAEERVNFAGIENKYNRLEQDFKRDIVPIWQGLTDDALKQVEAIIEGGDLSKINDLKLINGPEYKKLILNTMSDGFNYAKTGAADELEAASPATPKEQKDLLDQYAQMYVDKQYSDLLFNIRTAVNEAQRNHELSETRLSAKEILAAIGAMFAGFLTKHVEVGITAAIAAAVGMGRDTVFTAYENDIEEYEYSAILDRKTCPICRDLDGSVVDAEEYRDNQWNPPIHFHCRCLWVAIRKTEEDKPPVTGMPTEPGGFLAPPLQSPVFQFSMQHKTRVIV